MSFSQRQERTVRNMINCILCGEAFASKGSRVHDLSWDTANKTYKKDEKGMPKTYALAIHRDCYWKEFNAAKEVVGS